MVFSWHKTRTNNRSDEGMRYQPMVTGKENGDIFSKHYFQGLIWWPGLVIASVTLEHQQLREEMISCADNVEDFFFNILKTAWRGRERLKRNEREQEREGAVNLGMPYL